MQRERIYIPSHRRSDGVLVKGHYREVKYGVNAKKQKNIDFFGETIPKKEMKQDEYRRLLKANAPGRRSEKSAWTKRMTVRVSGSTSGAFTSLGSKKPVAGMYGRPKPR